MGTNYYFVTKDKAFAQECFSNHEYGFADPEYKLVDEPFFGYRIHICKFSCGWRSLFQAHAAYRSIKEIDEFYAEHKDQFSVYCEYGCPYEWEELRKEAIGRGRYKPEPLKWVYEIDKLFPCDRKPTLHFVDCSQEEAEFWTPIDHVLCRKTEEEARKRFGVYERFRVGNTFWNDPDYPVDWTDREFC